MSEAVRCPSCGKESFAKISKENGSIESVCNNCGTRHVDDVER
jgi:transcription elongation factor Elf1